MSKAILMGQIQELARQRMVITEQMVEKHKELAALAEAERADWKVEYEAYLKSPQWADKRLSAIERAGRRCQVCAAKGAPLDVHHNGYRNLGNEPPEDLLVVCRGCHERIHGIVGGKPTWVPGRKSAGTNSAGVVLDEVARRERMVR